MCLRGQLCIMSFVALLQESYTQTHPRLHPPLFGISPSPLTMRCQKPTASASSYSRPEFWERTMASTPSVHEWHRELLQKKSIRGFGPTLRARR